MKYLGKKHVVFLWLVMPCAKAQIRNYDAEGKSRKALYERVLISYSRPFFNPGPLSYSMLAPVAVGVLNAGIGLGVDLLDKSLSRRAEKFASQYEGKLVGDDFFSNGGGVTATSLHIARIAKLKGGDRELVMSHLDFQVEQGANAFRFRLDSCLLTRSKAKVKKLGQLGKTVDLNIQIQIDAIWTESDKAKSTIKSGTLGSASLTVPNVVLGTSFPTTSLPPMYSDWIPFFPANATDIRYTLSVVVKEANPYGLKAKEQSAYFSTAGNGLTKLLQSLLKDSN